MTGDPIPKALATAYRAANPSAREPCPVHTEQLDQRPTDHAGNFEFFVDARHSSYYAVYCATSLGYATREVAANDNVRSGTRAVPDPIRLYPSQRPGPKSEPEGAREAIVRVLDAATDDLSYYKRADAAGFTTAHLQLAAADRDTINDLLGRPSRSTARPIQGGTPNAARDAIARVLGEASGHLRYYARAAEGPFFQAVPRLSATDQRIVNALRTRGSVGTAGQ